MKLPKYPEYWGTGLRWQSEAPGHWKISRMRFMATLNPSKSEVASVDRNTQVSFLPMDAIGDDGALSLERTRAISEVESGYTYVRDGDVAVAKITPCFENGKGALMKGLANGIGFGTTELIVARPKPGKLDAAFLGWLFRSPNFRQEGEGCMYGAGGQKRVPDDFVRDLAWAFPPLEEQSAIAAFLDRETAKIEALIAEQERLLKLLAEKRQAVISHAVTKGLNPDAPMKESGVEWIGAVPAHWEVLRIKDVSRLESGHTPSKQVPEYWENCYIPWVSLNDSKNLAKKDYIDDTVVKISELGMLNSSARLLPAGAVVFTRDATIGLAAITRYPMAVSQHLIAWCPSERIRSMFLLRVFNAMREHLDSYTFGATIKTIGMQDVKTLVAPVPPVEEQQEIEEAINSRISEIDEAVSLSKRCIALLQERRGALISAAVTGQIDVREAA